MAFRSAEPEKLAQAFGLSSLPGEAFVVIWTTTPWTIPANRAVAYSRKVSYGLYRVVAAPQENWSQPGVRYVVADKLAGDVFKAARVESYERLSDVSPEALAGLTLALDATQHRSLFGDAATVTIPCYTVDDGAASASLPPASTTTSKE